MELTIHVISAPYFLITKLDAFTNRGNNDYLLSHDIEDMIAVLDGRAEIIEEVKNGASDLRNELGERFTHLLTDSRFTDAVTGHLQGNSTSEGRVKTVLETMTAIATICQK